MKIKRYVDKDMRLVLRRIRKDQGPDAVILSNRRVDEGIEVIAAVDYDQALVQQALGISLDSAADIDSDTLAAIAEPDAGAPAEQPLPDTRPEVISSSLVSGSGSKEESLHAMRSEISSLRGLVETQLSGLVWRETANTSAGRASPARAVLRAWPRTRWAASTRSVGR